MPYFSTDGSFDLRESESTTTFKIGFDKSSSENLFPIGLDNIQIVDKDICQPYEGPYFIRPKFSNQIFETKSKKMIDDLEINAIQVSRVSNPFGGITVYIGG